MKDLYCQPSIKNGLATNKDYANWKEYDFVEFKIELPMEIIEAKKISDYGIALQFNKFSLASINLLAGRNSTESWEIVKDYNQKAEYNVPETYYESLINLAKITPADLKYFYGREDTSFLVSQLLEKAVLFRNIKYSFAFELPNTKGIYWEKEDGKNLLNIFSIDENKGFAFWVHFEIKDRNEKDKILAKIIKSIEFKKNFSEKNEIKRKILEISKQQNSS